MLWLFFFFLLHVSVWLLFEGGVYFFGRPTDINDSWIRYVRAMQWQLLDAASSMCVASQSCCQPWKRGVNRNSLSASLVTVIRNYSHMCVCSASHGYYSRAAFILLRAPGCVATITGREWFSYSGLSHLPLNSLDVMFGFWWLLAFSLSFILPHNNILMDSNWTCRVGNIQGNFISLVPYSLFHIISE